MDSISLPAFSSREERRAFVEKLWREAAGSAGTSGAIEASGVSGVIETPGVSGASGGSPDLWDVCRLEWRGDVPLIRFRAFDAFPFVNAAFSTRFGGVSREYLGEMNLGFDRGDAPETVAENYRIFVRAMGASPEKLVLSDQIHETEVQEVTGRDACGDTIRKKLRGIDGLCTREEGLCLTTSYADCVPLLFVDPVRRAIASSHAGWRGTAGQMGARTVEKMGELFGSRPEDLVAVIGPSICRDCYQVGEEVADAFREAYSPEEAEKILAPGGAPGKYQLDLWEANVLTLKKAGLAPRHISVSGLCTCCHPRLFFSHRASGGMRGNLGGFLALAPGGD